MKMDATNNNHHDAVVASEMTAAMELIQLKYQQPSRTECRAAGKFLHAILHHGNATMSDSPLVEEPLFATKDNNYDATMAITPFKTSNNNKSSSLPMPVAGYNDDEYLSPLQCYVRAQCIEYFAATADADVMKARGRQTPVEEGRVGVRCVFCKELSRNEQASQASEFSVSLSLVLELHILIVHISCSFNCLL